MEATGSFKISAHTYSPRGVCPQYSNLHKPEQPQKNLLYYGRLRFQSGVQNKLLWESFRFLWSCIVNIRWRERTNKMQLIRCLLSNFLSQHISGIIMPIIRRIRPCPTACGVLPGCVGCGWLWSCGAASWAVCSAHSSRRILLVYLSSPYVPWCTVTRTWN